MTGSEQFLIYDPRNSINNGFWAISFLIMSTVAIWPFAVFKAMSFGKVTSLPVPTYRDTAVQIIAAMGSSSIAIAATVDLFRL